MWSSVSDKSNIALRVALFFFRLTVTDSDGVENSTFANLTVIKGNIKVYLEGIMLNHVFLV